MKVECREMTPEDRKTALEWLSRIGGNPFPEDFIPDTGVVGSIGSLACVIPVYFEYSSKVAVLGFCMIDPDLIPKLKHKAAETTMQYAIEYIKSKNRRHIISIFGNRSINRMAERIGMIHTENIEEKYAVLR